MELITYHTVFGEELSNESWQSGYIHDRLILNQNIIVPIRHSVTMDINNISHL